MWVSRLVASNKFCNKEPSVASSWPYYFHVLTTMHSQTHINLQTSFTLSDDTVYKFQDKHHINLLLTVKYDIVIIWGN